MKLVIATFDRDGPGSAGGYEWIADWPIIVERPLSLEDALCRATGLRPEVLRFAKLMEKKLRKHDEDRGQTWKDDGAWELYARLGEEEEELDLALMALEKRATGTPTRVAEEAADVANFAMMIADVVGGLKR